jgi:ABC-type polysaccharide/polyol phosphate transport system ATPase subunit
MISVNHLTKEFRIPHEKTKTLFHKLSSVFRTSYEYEKLLAVRDLSFDISEGEFVGIIGRNGSGKTTLLRILAGIYKPSRGTFAIDGDVSPFLDIGIGFQGDFSCRDNIYINGALLGFSRKEMDRRFKQIVSFAELERFADAKLENLSTGMRVRLAFAIAINSDAPVLLVDEVLAVGDTVFQQKCKKIFWEFKNSGKTILFVSHDAGNIREYCTRALVINEGQMVFDGEPEEAIQHYEKKILRI